MIRNEEEEQTPRTAAIRRVETENLVDLANILVQQMSADMKKIPVEVTIEERTATAEDEARWYNDKENKV